MLLTALLALALSVDSFLSGAAYGLRNVKITIPAKLVISVFSAIYAAVSIVLGNIINSAFGEGAKIFSSVLLSLVGLYIIYQGVFESDKTNSVRNNPKISDVDNSGKIEACETFMLSLALSIDSLSAGLAVSAMDVPLFLFPVLIGLYQAIFLGIGEALGYKISSTKPINRKLLAFISGLLIIIISVIKLLR